MGNEPLQAWLDSRPREDLQHMALLLYTRLPTIFGLKKTDIAAAVGEILQKNQQYIPSDIGLMTFHRTVESFKTRNKATTPETTS